MNHPNQGEAPHVQSGNFVETALRLAGKSDEEVRRTGQMDQGNDDVEAMFRHQTTASPVFEAVWNGRAPLDNFLVPPETGEQPWQPAMDCSIACARARLEAGTLTGADGKMSDETVAAMGEAGYWGMLIDAKYGGQGAPLRAFGPFLTRMAAQVSPWLAGVASVHGCIGAVDPVRAFGNDDLKARYLPILASGQRVSGFALTEPNAGSDLTAVRTTALPDGDDYLLTGEKFFITNAREGRILGVVAQAPGRNGKLEPAVFIVELPDRQTDEFQLERYGLYALRALNNQGIRFNNFRVPGRNRLQPKKGNGLTIAYRGLNLGRMALCAFSAGSMRRKLADMLPWTAFRRTYGQPIQVRELVKRRIARGAGLIVAADATALWTAWLLDQGYRGELEGIIAKVFGSEANKEFSIELLMKTLGGRAFLHGSSFGDGVFEDLAPCIYEGESEVLGLAFFKSLVQEHGKQFMEPIGKKFAAAGIKKPNLMNPAHLWLIHREALAYARWKLGKQLSFRDRQSVPGMDRRLQEHVSFALDRFGKQPLVLSGAMTKHQLKLGDRQCRCAALSQGVQDLVLILVTACYAHQKGDPVTIAAADVFCHDQRRKTTGKPASDGDFRRMGELADAVIEGQFTELAGVVPHQIMRPYRQD